ncbi:MAG: hypothetical protein C4296_03250 [Gemmataceae bacterium]
MCWLPVSWTAYGRDTCQMCLRNHCKKVGRLVWPLAALTIAIFLNSAGPPVVRASDRQLPPATYRRPILTEEREAAAMHFVKKHIPDLVPILQNLKNRDANKYAEEMLEIFQVTEWFAELQATDEKRYELELEIWKTEHLASVLVAKLAAEKDNATDESRKQLQTFAQRLVDLEIQVLRHRVEVLEKELSETREEMNRMEDHRADLVKERFNGFFEQIKRWQMK